MKAKVHAVTLMLARPRNKKATLIFIATHIEIRMGPTKYCFQGFPICYVIAREQCELYKPTCTQWITKLRMPAIGNPTFSDSFSALYRANFCRGLHIIIITVCYINSLD